MRIPKLPALAAVVAALFATLLFWRAVHLNGTPSHTLPAPGIALGKPEVVLPMGSFKGRPVVDARVDGQGPFRFVLDTGASGTVIAESLAVRLGLSSLGNARVSSSMGLKAGGGRLVRLGKVEIGDATLSEVSAVATDLGLVFREPEDPVGVLSATGLFPGHLLTFDYPGARIVLRAGELPPADGADVLDYAVSHGLPSVRITVGGVSLDAILDTGSIRGLTLPASFTERIPLASKPEPAGTGRMVDREFELRAAKLRGALQLGRFRVDDPLVHFVEGEQEGNVGYETLRRFSLTFDAKNRRLKVEAGS